MVSIGLDGSGQRLFEQNADACRDQQGGVFAMVFSRGDNYGGVAYARFGQCFDRRKDSSLGTGFSDKTVSAAAIDLRERGEFAGTKFRGEFMQVKGVYRAHTSQASYGNS
jgi:hypothetical protein